MQRDRVPPHLDLFVSGGKATVSCKDAGEAQAIVAEIAGALQR